MDKKDSSGPAFPLYLHKTGGSYYTGMTLRDYFAAMALQGVMVNSEGIGGMSLTERAEMFAKGSAMLYEIADAMLKARA